MSTIANEPAITITNEELKILQDMVYLNGGANAYEYNEYVHGVSDGMELVMAYIERREPLFRKSDKGLYKGVMTVTMAINLHELNVEITEYQKEQFMKEYRNGLKS